MNRQADLVDELKNISTEGQNPNTLDIDLLDSLGVVKKINTEDQKVAVIVGQLLPEIAQGVDLIVEAFACGGRLIYIGAGTSGRLGVLDSVECPPTFSVSSEQVIGILAGGAGAMYKAVEGAEDNRQLAIDDLKAVHLSSKDVLVGIAASGRTPYVLSAMAFAKEQGAAVIGISCSVNSSYGQNSDVDICAVVGAEVLTGSTRMKSGTAQKLILNMLSTASMIRSGKSYKNLMIDVNASNEKLYARAIRIVMQATECDFSTAEHALGQANNQTKLASLMVLTGLDLSQAKAALLANKGFLRKAIEQQGC
ncbi:N-acetylmuramic acid 6-phosphate etherase [Colwellia sp. MT41]|uniref:N-acetylmuramic acid 6-phosphate etherase n=1 Tax=Colwellia marinimaniae TaxID=1513592 RepID=A0ABQ0MXD0_9GAMM|nr:MULTISPECIES: N-acetylmuramic acid 6-phosphate etherase [Colwellia]ALO34646.1 N-acetylmuramic acid 6-phosphate etherase [Colwellia sp. MT41]GAW97010.1 N-acetylmuramic acid 6-phosphate etherase 1 [Colwellia marinimaniae]